MDPITLLAIRKFAPYVIGFIAVSVFLGYLHHKIDAEGYGRCDAQYKERDAKDAIIASDILAKAEKTVTDERNKNAEILTGVLTHNAETIKTLADRHAADLDHSVRVTTKANANRGNALPGKANVSKGADSGGQGTCDTELAEDNKRKLIDAEYRIERLADLHKSCIDEIERTHILK